MACGDKYKHLAVTKDGYTFENPNGAFPTFNDYDGWFALAQDVSLQARDRLRELGRVECEATGGTNCTSDDAEGGSYPIWNAQLELANKVREGAANLTSPWLNFDPAGNIAQAMQVVRDSLCLMESADQGIEQLGGTVPVTPGVGPTPKPAGGKESLGGVLGAVLGLVVVALLVRRKGRE